MNSPTPAKQALTKLDLEQFKVPASAIIHDHNQPFDFDSAGGEAFVGLNLLSLEEGQADGPFVLSSIEPKWFGVGKARKELNQYIAMKGTTPVIMPISASFLMKAEGEAKLQIGDVFGVKRTANYDAKESGQRNCKSYLIKVLSRAKSA